MITKVKKMCLTVIACKSALIGMLTVNFPSGSFKIEVYCDSKPDTCDVNVSKKEDLIMWRTWSAKDIEKELDNGCSQCTQSLKEYNGNG